MTNLFTGKHVVRLNSRLRDRNFERFRIYDGHSNDHKNDVDDLYKVDNKEGVRRNDPGNDRNRLWMGHILEIGPRPPILGINFIACELV